MLTGGSKGGSSQPIILINPEAPSAQAMNNQSGFYKEPNSNNSFYSQSLFQQQGQAGSRKIGWTAEYERTFTPQTFSYFPHHYTIDEIEIWIRRHRIDDLQRRIAVQDFESNDPDIRSPSPEPVYDQKTGLRVNTREQRLKDRYIKERNRLITEVSNLDPTYIPPPDYKQPKKNKKIYIPDPDNPSLNYIGQIIGPAGQTQQKLEKESKCRIQIRGKGSQNKNRIYNKEEADENEPLYVLVTANTNEDLEKGAAMVEAILLQTDENKKYSLVVYDHLTSTKKIWCEVCGEVGHKFYECPEKLLTGGKSSIYCSICGSKNHPIADCPDKKKKKIIQEDEITIEEEYHNLMNELRNEKEQKEKFKAITGKEPPRDFNYLQFQAEQDSLKGGNVLAIQADDNLAAYLQNPSTAYLATQDEVALKTTQYPQNYQTPYPANAAYAGPQQSAQPNQYYQQQQQYQAYYSQQSSVIPQLPPKQGEVTEQIDNIQEEEQCAEQIENDEKDQEMRADDDQASEVDVTKKSEMSQQLLNQQQQAYQQQQQTQIGAQSIFKPYAQPVAPQQQPQGLPTVPHQQPHPYYQQQQQHHWGHQQQYPPNHYAQQYNYNQYYYNQYYYPYQYGAAYPQHYPPGYMHPVQPQGQPGQVTAQPIPPKQSDLPHISNGVSNPEPTQVPPAEK